MLQVKSDQYWVGYLDSNVFLQQIYTDKRMGDGQQVT